MCSSVSSPADEEGVHDSFNQLIAEQSQNEEISDISDQEPLERRELDMEDQGTQFTCVLISIYVKAI